MRVTASIENITLEGDYANEIDSVEATCSRCGHTTQSYGQHEDSIRRCLVLLRDECPLGESNYYVEES